MAIEFLGVAQVLLSFVSIGLLFVTIYLSWQSRIAQKQMGIRQSLEELDDIEIDEHLKIKPLLHSFDYSFRNSKTKVLFKLYEPGTKGRQASKPKKPDYSLYKQEKQIEWIENQLKGFDGYDDEIESLQSDKYGILLTLNTENPVTIRNWTDRTSSYFLPSIGKHSPMGELPPHRKNT